VTTMMALSVRQPWAWLIMAGHKDVENRSWCIRTPIRIWIHAASGMTRAEYAWCWLYAAALGVEIPPFSSLVRGCLLGTIKVEQCCHDTPSPWYDDVLAPWGWVLSDPRPLKTPWRCRGQLGLFRPESIPEEEIR